MNKIEKIQIILKGAIEGIDAVVTMPECTINSRKEELELINELQNTLNNAIKDINAVVTMPECTINKTEK
jgi:hypothetical protein